MEIKDYLSDDEQKLFAEVAEKFELSENQTDGIQSGMGLYEGFEITFNKPKVLKGTWNLGTDTKRQKEVLWTDSTSNGGRALSFDKLLMTKRSDKANFAQTQVFSFFNTYKWNRRLLCELLDGCVLQVIGVYNVAVPEKDGRKGYDTKYFDFTWSKAPDLSEKHINDVRTKLGLKK